MSPIVDSCTLLESKPVTPVAVIRPPRVLMASLTVIVTGPAFRSTLPPWVVMPGMPASPPPMAKLVPLR